MPAWSSSWQLPDQIADVLPSEARHIEELRRLWLDTARSYGYELVMPPLLEHIESLLLAQAKHSTCKPLSWLTNCLVARLACGQTLPPKSPVSMRIC